MDRPVREWQPMKTAPRDGTAIQARIPGYGDDNIIAWAEGFLTSEEQPCGCWQFVEDQEPPECWTDGVCWEVNADGDRSIHPTRWCHIAPLPSSSEHQGEG